MSLINGKIWVDSHSASVRAILGDQAPPVFAKGSNFYNRDHWTARILFAQLVRTIKFGNKMDYHTIADAVNNANYKRVDNPAIVVAVTPDRVPLGLARASIGGNYHEAWHTLYSCRRQLSVEEVYEPFMALWPLLDDWAPFVESVLHWGNLIEDIRIERLGCKQFVGAQDKMEDLQDLILRMEKKGEDAAEHKGVPRNDDLGVIMGAFRDLGLGYDTVTQRFALDEYKKRSPIGWKLVTEGELRPHLDRAISMTAEDDLGHWWLAMEIVAKLVEIGTTPIPEPEEEPEGGQAATTANLDDIDEVVPPDRDDKDQEPQEAPPTESPMPYNLYKVGDRAKLKSGPYKGREVEVTFAGLPNPEGIQDLRFALVEDNES